MAVTDSLAYYDTGTIITAKGSIVQAPPVIFNLFFLNKKTFFVNEDAFLYLKDLSSRGMHY